MKPEHRLVLRQIAKALTYVNNKQTNAALERLQALGGIDRILDEVASTIPPMAPLSVEDIMRASMAQAAAASMPPVTHRLVDVDACSGFMITQTDPVDKKTRYYAGAFQWSEKSTDAILYVKKEHAEIVMKSQYRFGCSVVGV